MIMPNQYFLFYFVVASSIALDQCLGAALTFDIRGSSKECFYEKIPKNSRLFLEFQVVVGRHHDIDVTVRGPNQELLYNHLRVQHDLIKFTIKNPGTYSLCFSNEFSIFTHKTIYFDFHSEPEELVPTSDAIVSGLEISVAVIAQTVSKIKNMQMHHKLWEMEGRDRAEELNTKVLLWSIMESAFILAILVGQIFLVKRNFTNNIATQRTFRLDYF